MSVVPTNQASAAFHSRNTDNIMNGYAGKVKANAKQLAKSIYNLTINTTLDSIRLFTDIKKNGKAAWQNFQTSDNIVGSTFSMINQFIENSDEASSQIEAYMNKGSINVLVE